MAYTTTTAMQNSPRFQVCTLVSQWSAKMKSQAVSQNLAEASASEISNMGCLANVFPMAGSGNYRDFSPIASPVARPPVFAHRLAQASHERQCQIRRPTLGHEAKQVALESRRTHLHSTVLHSIFCCPTIKGCGFLASCSSRQHDYSQRHRP